MTVAFLLVLHGNHIHPCRHWLLFKKRSLKTIRHAELVIIKINLMPQNTCILNNETFLVGMLKKDLTHTQNTPLTMLAPPHIVRDFWQTIVTRYIKSKCDTSN